MALLLKKNSESLEDLYRPHIKEVNAPLSKARSISNLDRRLNYDPIARHERYERKKNRDKINGIVKTRKQIISNEEIKRMRKLFSDGIASRKDLAEMFNCSYSMACKIISREYFKDVE